jgi:hypothetical protein
MVRLDPSPNRNGLGFEEAVRQSFRFVDDYGLLLVESGPTFVRYESKDVFLNVYHGRASYEMGVEIGRLSKQAEKLNLYDVLNAKNALIKEGLSGHTTFQASSREHVLMLVPKLSSLVKEYADLLLQADDEEYRTVLEQESRRAAEETRAFQLNQVRRSAEQAWHDKQYDRLIDLYGPWRKHLTESETMKLSYSERHASEGRRFLRKLIGNKK